MEELIVGLLKLFCPFLRKMAQKTGSPLDDMIVSILCKVTEKAPEKKD